MSNSKETKFMFKYEKDSIYILVKPKRDLKVNNLKIMDKGENIVANYNNNILVDCLITEDKIVHKLLPNFSISLLDSSNTLKVGFTFEDYDYSDWIEIVRLMPRIDANRKLFKKQAKAQETYYSETVIDLEVISEPIQAKNVNTKIIGDLIPKESKVAIKPLGDNMYLVKSYQSEYKLNIVVNKEELENLVEWED